MPDPARAQTPAKPGLPAPVQAVVDLAARELVVLGELVDSVVAVAFGPSRERRSAEYRAGFRAVLMRLATGHAMPCPYPAGDARADAWHAGVAEGYDAWRQVTGHLTAMGTLRDAVAHRMVPTPRQRQHA